MGEARRRQRASGERAVEHVYEIEFVTPGAALLDVLLSPCAETGAAMGAILSALRRIEGPRPPLCAACDDSVQRSPPPLIAVTKPFARRGDLVVGVVCRRCAAGKDRDALGREVLARLRDGGVFSNVRELEAGTA